MTDDRLADIRNASIEIFSVKGYHGTSMRDIAAAVDLNISTLYHYYRDKQSLFYDVMSTRLLSLKRRMSSEISGKNDPTEKIRGIVACIVEHNTRPAGQSMATQLRWLDEPYRGQVVQIHDDLQALVEEVIREGVEQGCFTTPDVKIATYFMFAIGYSVSIWYKPKGRLNPEEVAEAFSELVLVGLRSSETPAARQALPGNPASM